MTRDALPATPRSHHASSGLRVFEPESFSAVETLRDGRSVEIRALRAADRTGLLAAISRGSPQSLYRRFFAAKRQFSESETAFFMNVDFVSQAALVAIVEEQGLPALVGGARYVLIEPHTAELAFFVVDEFQGQGIGAALMRHLTAIARDAGLTKLVAEVLPDNRPMLALFERCGLRAKIRRDPRVVHVALELT